MLLRISITTLWLVILAGCSANYKNTTDYKLCYSQATLPANNIFQGARAAEVKSRGLDCRSYASRIDEEEKALKLAKAGAKRVTNKTTVQQPVWKSNTIICNTVGGTTICN